MNSREIIEQINNNPSGEIIRTIKINDRDYKLKLYWNSRVRIKLGPKNSLITETDFSEIRKLPLISIIVRTPQYGLRGEKTELTEKLLLNEYTRALLYFPASKLICQNSKISYSAALRKKDSHQLETIINYFKALLNTSK